MVMGEGWESLRARLTPASRARMDLSSSPGRPRPPPRPGGGGPQLLHQPRGPVEPFFEGGLRAQAGAGTWSRRQRLAGLDDVIDVDGDGLGAAQAVVADREEGLVGARIEGIGAPGNGAATQVG